MDAFVAQPQPGGAFCPSCGEVLPLLEELQRRLADAQALIETQEENLRDLEYVQRGLRSQISRLRGEADEQIEASPHADDAREVFQYWCHSPAGRNAKAFSMERFKHVVARLREGHSVAEIKRAIDGASRNPRKGYKRTDLLTICRNEPNLLMFIDFAERAAKPAVRPPPTPPPASYGDAIEAKHEEANRWRNYAEELNGSNPKVARRVLELALLLDTNSLHDRANRGLRSELRNLTNPEESPKG